MRVRALQVRDLRILEAARLEPGSGINVLWGANGAGKTSLLEALALLGRGRSFRDPRGLALVRRGAGAATVAAEVEGEEGRRERLGLRRDRAGTTVRVEGRSHRGAGALLGRLPVVWILGESYQLVEGPPALRRELLDWGVFHVEPGYAVWMRRYRRALRQRNAALRSGDLAAAAAWEAPLAEAAEAVAAARARYVAGWAEAVRRLGVRLLAGAEVTLALEPGWRGALAEALAAGRARDALLGSTQAGPHRADLAVRWAGAEARRLASRGQARRLAYALVLGQVLLTRELGREPPVVLVDEFASELDAAARAAVLALLRELRVQVWITTTERAAIPPEAPAAWFHVEQGRVRPML
ncbi:DNA replication/repair protein RecF [Inmirania thermothiophila]|uniref:DNA replication and repair protein RecF n=1 Tax=Inmirania thermothiophila TaxID=1750597 RepID=A0A3N1Y6B6_9GAMM|nr:DNA replication and repair protein RecF [Inmirania thermothiophila]ROR34359.1 DNA replication and repair protein RecF [Inmirania thermothiophila]